MYFPHGQLGNESYFSNHPQRLMWLVSNSKAGTDIRIKGLTTCMANKSGNLYMKLQANNKLSYTKKQSSKKKASSVQVVSMYFPHRKFGRTKVIFFHHPQRLWLVFWHEIKTTEKTKHHLKKYLMPNHVAWGENPFQKP